MTGAWGCFDEFNRILIEVLSVVATQVKSILDAIASRQETFPFQDDVIPLVPTVGAFITMNPGYKVRLSLCWPFYLFFPILVEILMFQTHFWTVMR